MNKEKAIRESKQKPLSPEKKLLLSEIISGLQKSPKELPTKLFYDERGSRLFDQICLLDEYYLTRTEIEIMDMYIHEMIDLIKSNCILIEYGSGNSAKTRRLLNHLPTLAAYLPVDISEDYLNLSSQELRIRYPNLEVFPILADYTKPFAVPEQIKLAPRLAYFPGSTIGNFKPEQAIEFLQNIATVIGPGGAFLIGVDLLKDADVLHAAYNDSQGVTAAFNLNILTHINNLFGSLFNEANFEHRAFFNEAQGRIEMHLNSKVDQTILITSESIHFKKNENILTEVSYKYSLPGFSKLASEAGFDVRKVWTDPKEYFSIQYLIAR